MLCKKQVEQDTGGGVEPRFNPGSNSGAGSEGGRANINIKNLGSTQVQPRFNPS